MPKTDMYDQTRIKMKCLFHNEWKEKFVTLNDIWKWTQNGKLKKRVNAVRDIDAISSKTGMGIGFADSKGERAKSDAAMLSL